MSIFEQATRKALRFASPQGDLSVEDLWTLPLKSEKINRASLNGVAVHIDLTTQTTATKNFVDETTVVDADELLKLEIVKHIIAVRKAENAAAAKKLADKHQLEQLKALLADRQNDQLKSLSVEELQDRIKELLG